MTTSPDSKSIDVLVGGRLRLRRTELGMSQEELASAIGVSYQRIQLYENGAASLTVGRLVELARKLELPLLQLLDGLTDAGATGGATAPRLSKSQLEIAHGFAQLSDDAVRAALAGLVRAAVRQQG